MPFRAALLLVTLLLASGAEAQNAVLRIETDSPSARVVVDGETLGAASEQEFSVAPGSRQIALVEAGSAWDVRRTETMLTLASDDTVQVRLDLPVRTRIESLPLHAEVAILHADGRREVLGPTPLVIDRARGLDGTLVATLDGYTESRVIAPEAGGRVSMVLRPEGPEQTDAQAYALPTQRKNTARTVLDVGLGVVAVAAGAVAVHYKFQADAADEAYRGPTSLLRGEPELRDDAIRYDTVSGIALGVSTASLGILALRFAIR